MVIVAALLFPIVGAVGLVVTTDQLAIAALIAGLGVVHTEVLVGIERTRRKLSTARPANTGHTDLSSVWIFAAALLLPPTLSAPVAFIVHTHLWFRAYRPVGNPAYRSMFSRATMMLACYGVGAVISGAQVSIGDGVTDLREFAVVLCALLAYLTINTGLVVAGVSLAVPDATVRSMLSSADDNILEISTLGLGAVFAVMLTGNSPWMVVLLLPLLLILHRAVTVQQLEMEAATDDETGLLNSPAWHRRALRELRSARRWHRSATLLLIDIDGFRKVNEEHGYAAGNLVLAAIGQALPRGARGQELLGRFSGEEFAILVPTAVDDEVYQLSRRLKTEIASLRVDVESPKGHATVEGLSASIGGAHFPGDGGNLEELLDAADRALRHAKRTGSLELRPPTIDTPSLGDYRRARARDHY
ncbi:GGDEF domain-containing protein (plasmid) [Pseudonocardia sp. DSM 110487]|uniref:sensor domain-containing diguanylate cyclase n=1 Tax=Pseudonocardia sp. DSM 110487 TaxID=2865833 RepID=UPI001C6A1D15|nr:GGDEF domain-containing protein [Pseudonocardia sp. DSM 110487]QYN41134.1 GGDEF domain-containing protein [Pseudonocardia sp. DSM 110487]